MITLKIAFRNIFRQKRRSLLTALTMAGGVILAAISIGWSDGTYTTIIEMFTRNRLGHIQLHKGNYRSRPSLYKTIRHYEQVGDTLSRIRGVEFWSPRLYAGGLASVRDKSAGIQLYGVDPELENKATHLNEKIIEGKNLSTPSREALLGKGLANVLNASVGDSVVFLSQAADGSIANDRYTVVGLVESGDQMADRTAFYLHLVDAQQVMALPDQVHEIVVIASDLEMVDPLVDRIQSRLQNKELQVAPWQVFAKSFYQAMQADVQGMWIMLLVIMLIVAVGVLNTVLMSVLERTREYGLLKAVGTRPYQILVLIIYEVSFLSLISIVVGTLVGIILNSTLAQQGVPLPQAFTYGGIEFTKMYTTVNLRSITLPALTVLVTAVLVSIFPGIKAARNNPAKSMRTH